MFAIQCVRVGNDLTNKLSDHVKEEQKTEALDWLSLSNESTMYDIMARQLRPTLPDLAALEATENGWDQLRYELFEIDAHLFTCMLPMLICTTETAKCRRCFRDQAKLKTCNDKMLYMLHTVGLEGTNRFFNGVVDYICGECSISLCNRLVQKYSKQNFQPVKILRIQICKQTICDTLKCDRPTKLDDLQLYQLLYLLTETVGYQVDTPERGGLLVQGRFSALVLEMHRAKSQSLFGRQLSTQDVSRFVSCASCHKSLLNANRSDSNSSEDSIGVLSTIYYDTARAFATPYFVCKKCKPLWSSETPSAAQKRTDSLILLHQRAVRECFAQVLRCFSCTPLRICGVGKNMIDDCRSEWEKLIGRAKQCFDDSNMNETYVGNTYEENFASKSIDRNQNVLVEQVESDLLNKLFGLERIEKVATKACKPLFDAISSKKIEKQTLDIRKCLCDNCTRHNLKVLEPYSVDSHAQNHFDTFKSATQIESAIVIMQRQNNQCSSTHFLPGNVECRATRPPQADKDWRLPRKIFPRGHRKRCAYEFNSMTLENTVFEKFLNETCHFLSPMF